MEYITDNPHGICRQYVDALQENANSQETRIKTLSGIIERLQEQVDRLTEALDGLMKFESGEPREYRDPLTTVFARAVWQKASDAVVEAEEWVSV